MKEKNTLSDIWFITKTTFSKFSQDNCATLAAALSYYMVFSIAPTLVIVIALVGTFFGKDAIEGEIYNQIKHLLGNEGALTLQTFIRHTYEPNNSFVATIIGIVTLVFGATGVFTHLKFSLNTIYNVKPNPKREIVKVLADRLMSFAFILGIGFILIVTLVIHALLAVLSDFIVKLFASYSIYIISVVNLSITVVILAFLFAAMFKVLPDARSKWKDIIVGGFFTSILFILGELLIGFYLGSSNFASTYGAAGSIIIILVWVNYSSFILFLGACFTYVYAKRRGYAIRPNKFALKLRPEDAPFHDKQGSPTT